MSESVQSDQVQGPRSPVRLPHWAKTYQRSWLVSDLIAGVTLAAYAIPVSLAYSSLAGLPPHHGIYCYLIGGFVYAFLASSRQLAIGPTSAISMLVGATIAKLTSDDPSRWITIAALTALTTAVVFGLAWLLRLSSLANFVSETILVGFKTGAALTIAMTQIPKLFGVEGGGENFFERVWVLVWQLPQSQWTVIIFGVVCLALLLLGEYVFPGRPVALVIVVASIVVMSIFPLEQYGLSVVGHIPQGLPDLQLPSFDMQDLDGVLPLALACFLLSYIESISAARTLAMRNQYAIDARQELLALGAANLSVAFVQGFPVAGGLSQSAVNDKAGAKSPLALVLASLSLAICLLFLTGLVQNLPTVVLAVIVLGAIRGLIDLSAFRMLRKISPLEFGIALVALLGVLVFGILNGVLLAAVISLAMLVAAAARPNIAFLGRIPGTHRFSDIERHPENESIAGCLVFRVEASILYFNVEHILECVESRIRRETGLHSVICDLSNSPYVDVAGTRMLAALHEELASRGIQFYLVEAHSHVRDVLRAAGIEDRVGVLDRSISLDQMIHRLESDNNKTERNTL